MVNAHADARRRRRRFNVGRVPDLNNPSIPRLDVFEPELELALPVDDDGVGHDDQVRPVVLFVLPQVKAWQISLVASEDAVEVKRRALDMRWMTWRATCVYGGQCLVSARPRWMTWRAMCVYEGNVCVCAGNVCVCAAPPQVRDEGAHLHGLPQAHLVGQDVAAQVEFESKV
jgi:hypothetical protein